AFFLQQEFEIAGQRRTRMDAAAQGTQKARWDVKSFEKDLVAAVRTAFVDALVSRDRVRLAEKGVRIAATLSQELAHEQQLSDVQRLDLNVAQIQESRAQRQLAAAERTRDDSLDVLRRLLNLPIDQAIELQGTAQHKVSGLPPAVELIERALRQRPDLVALRHGAQQAARQLALTRREAIPNLTLSGTLSRFEGDTLIGGDIGISLPIFHGKSAGISDAIAERDRANLELHNLERTVAEETADARRACVVAAGDLQTLRDVIVPKSEENLRLEEHLYKGGIVTVSELVGLQIDLLSAQSDYLDALQTYNDALVELERVIGGSINSSP
ncbi:MAG: TolC family protein, partial [Candidatus Binatia bacterium]